MSKRDRSLIVITTLAAMAVIAFQSRPLFHELRFRKWTTPLQPQSIVHGIIVGAVVGIVIGSLMFLACMRRRRNIPRFVVTLCAGVAISGVVGAIAALFGTPGWPSEMQYGIDGDILLSYGFAAGIMGSVFSTGLLAAVVPVMTD